MFVLLLPFILTLIIFESNGAGIVIQIPNTFSHRHSNYRLAYDPPIGKPPSNSPINDTDIIKFTDALPGTRYFFWIYSLNNSTGFIWTVNASTQPDPPKNLKINVTDTKSVLVSWERPEVGGYSEFILKLTNVTTDKKFSPREVKTNDLLYQFYDLFPGATYQLKVFSVFEGRESEVYISRNFTTMPNTPGRFIVWFRNETTLLVLWQPPYPAGIFSEYVVSITPNDTEISVISVKKENDPPGPAQAAFNDLVPGRAYNISVQTVSEDQFSLPTKAVYRTLPLRPYNLTFDYSSITPYSFILRWSEPKEFSEFIKYSISLNSGRKQIVILKNRDEERFYEFREHLEPGMTYQVSIKTVADKVSSYSTNGNITLLPLPVHNLSIRHINGSFMLYWNVLNNSHQNAFKILYHETESLVEDSSTLITNETSFLLNSLLPGRNYSISVRAISNTTESTEVTRYLLTKPSTPVIGDLKPLANGLKISWKSDVNSKQDYFRIQWIRNDTGEKFNDTTAEFQYHINNLYPGAGYIVQLFAISHNLSSDPQEYFQPIFPKPPEHLRLIKLSENSILIRWDEPVDTLFSEYSSRLRTSNSEWSDPNKINTTSFEINDLYPGELYVIQINTVSYNLESVSPQQITYTIRPDPVRNISSVANSHNVSLLWVKPRGIVQRYLIRWMNIETEESDLEQDVKEFIPLQQESDDVQVLIENLRSGYMYFFNISTFSNQLESNITELQVRTLPLIDSDIIIITDTNSITIRYTETPRSLSKFDRYKFSVNDDIGQFHEKDFDDKNQTVIFRNLIPGYLYDVIAWTVSFNITSKPLIKKARLYPEQISYINATYISDTRVDLSWDTPNGIYDDFLVTYLRNENDVDSSSTNQTFISLNKLRPYRNYTFSVTVRSGVNTLHMSLSQPVSATYQTSESVPERVENFRPIDVQPTNIHFQWSLRSEWENGILLRYTITYGLEDSIDRKVLDFGPNENEGHIKQLLPGQIYVFQIQAETRIGYGLATEYKQKMPILAPPRPASQVVPTEVFRSKNTIQVRFRKNYFTDDNGNITAYTVIVAEDTSKNTSGLEMPSWYDVQAYSRWPPYQVLEPYYPFTNNSIEDFTIGTENCDLHQSGYCNGPLKSGTTYKVKVRAFTAPDKFTDTSYSFPMQTDNDNTSAIMSMFITLLFSIILCAFVMLLIRHKKFYEKSLIGKTVDNLSLPESMIETTRPVRIENFSNHYRIMSADSDFRFSEEFEELKHVGRDQPCSFADLPCNRPKNRFTNILPYDHSRFKLQPVDDEEGSDYINANYVPGFSSPREFIVTQGPLHSTHDDFWRMCWESNSRAIVMLTRCIEKGREKCDHYWPYDTMPVYYGDISVQILNDSHYSDWSITEFLVCRANEQRVMRHFHFTTWPDFGVPNPPQILIKFVRAFRERVDPDQRPIVVHCSAGVGRSGTFIALDRVLQLIKLSDTVDIFGIVYQMRKERVWMVQTEQQYICIHQCLLAVLDGKENSYLMLHRDNELLNQSYDDVGGVSLINNTVSTNDLNAPKEDILMIDGGHDDEKDSAIIEGDDGDEYLSETDKDDKQSQKAVLLPSTNQ